MASENLWLGIVAAGFFLCAIIFFVDPTVKSNFARDIGVNVATDSLFTAMTILVINLFLVARQNHEWNSVKAQVNEKIANTVSGLLYQLLNLCEISTEKNDVHAVVVELATSEKRILREDIVEHLSQSANHHHHRKGKSYVAEHYYNSESYLETFRDDKKYLHDLRIDYSRFIEANITSSIMKLENECDGLSVYFEVLALRTDFSFHKELSEASKSTEEERNLYESQREAFMAFLLEYINPAVQNAIRAIQGMIKLGLQVNIPFVPHKKEAMERSIDWALYDLYPLR